MNVLIKRNGEAPVFEEIEKSDEAIFEFIGGSFASITLPVTCGEIAATLITYYGQDRGASEVNKNCDFMGYQIYGDFLVCGMFGGAFVSDISSSSCFSQFLTDIPWDEKLCKVIFKELWEEQ